MWRSSSLTQFESDLHNLQLEVSSVHVQHAIKVDKKRKLKLEVSNA